MQRALLLASLLALAACRNEPDKPDTDTLPPEDTGPELVDADGDGFGTDEDCNDSDASIHPDAEEICDGIDNDCDAEIDEEVMGTFFEDADGDGYGAAESATEACEQPTGYVADDTDCDDDDARTQPGAPERCDGLDNDCDGEVDEELNELWFADGDGDGFGDPDTTLDSCDPGEGWVVEEGDCDDADEAIHPGAEERCNDRDDDCDGAIDEELDSSWYADADGDGFGDPASERLDCEPGDGWVEDASDCDDANSGIHPDAIETCDELDNDCDGLVDDGDDSVTGTSTWYGDADGDGYGDAASATEACEQPSGTAAYAGDCDDGDAAYNPGASEEDCTDPNDYNCDGSSGYADDDGDGWAACEDCDDGDAAIHEGAEERCDGVDNDCDGVVDEDDAVDPATWYADGDGDGYGDPSSTTRACDQPTGFVSATYATDCDDSDADVSPVDPERCDGVDNDCDGATDEAGAVDATTWYLDYDGDGYGGARVHTEACSQPSGYTADSSDCDDTDASAHPGATELCDGADNDCDGDTDEADAADASAWYTDSDGDGYGDPTSATTACTAPSGQVADDSDCDDGDAAVHPGAAELCNGLDDDCDGLVDDADPEVTGDSTWYADDDGDGFGDAAASTRACSQPTGFVADDSDCDDGDAGVHPSALEGCNGVDDDCDGLTDEGDATDASTWYADADGDGFGDAAASARACSQPTGHVSDSSDCDDSNAVTHPGAGEVCDGLDNDCDGDTDEGALLSWYADSDGDGHGDSATSAEACTAPAGYVRGDGDCDDGDAAIHPAADEYCNGVDDDCDGMVDERDAADAATWYADSDGDGYGSTAYTASACSQPSGYVADSSDCDDNESTIHPAADEYCNGVDDDCDGHIDEDSALDTSTWYADGDGDGYGGDSSTTQACELPSGYAGDASDCDDGDASIHPGAEETCNGVDDDCDGSADDGHLGSDATCAAESCLEVLLDDPGATDGSYWLDPTGAAALYECDMSTDGGGWTLLADWDRESEGDGLTELEAMLTVEYDTMSVVGEEATSVAWCDGDESSDVLAYSLELYVPNQGEVLLDVHYYGWSMQHSGIWMYVEDETGANTDILCMDDDADVCTAEGNCLYDSTEQSYWPYACSSYDQGDWSHTWNGDYQAAAGAPLETFRLTSMMDDSYADYSYLYRLAVWVR
jgi:hypothetical protein